MLTPTKEQALETYRMTVLNYNRSDWPLWCLVVSNSLASGEWIGGEKYPAYAKEIFDELIKTKKPAMADSK